MLENLPNNFLPGYEAKIYAQSPLVVAEGAGVAAMAAMSVEAYADAFLSTTLDHPPTPYLNTSLLIGFWTGMAGSVMALDLTDRIRRLR